MDKFSDARYGLNRLFQKAYTVAGVQEVIELPYMENGFSVQASPTDSSVIVEASNDGVSWVPWSVGIVQSAAIEKLSPVRFLRFNIVVGSSCLATIWGY